MGRPGRKPTQSAGLRRARRHFDGWRRSRATRRIPEELWRQAVELAAEHGVHRTAKALRLNAQSLRERMPASQIVSGAPATAFVELAPLPVSVPAACVLVVEDREGARMRIELRGVTAEDVATVARGFVGRR